MITERSDGHVRPFNNERDKDRHKIGRTTSAMK